MPSKRKPLPKTQVEISQDQIQPYDGQGKVPSTDLKKRALQKRTLSDDPKTLTVGLKDIDEAIVYYFNEVIRPSVIQNGTKVTVPILYGSPERWKAVQADGFYRDKNGKIQTPLILFKRDNIEKNRSVSTKIDANNPTNYGIFQKKYSRKNIYDTFSVLTNRVPVNEYYGVIIPDYVNITYSCIIFTDYVEQMNKLVEGINFASDSYWGSPDKFKFRAMINNYSTAVELVKGQDRAVKTTFNIDLFGHIITDAINAKVQGIPKYFSKSSVTFGVEVEGNLEILLAKAATPQSAKGQRIIDNAFTQAQTQTTLSPQQIIFINTSNTAIADTITLNQAIFTGKNFLVPPPGFSIDEDSFNVYVNGVVINPPAVLVENINGNIVATFSPNLIGYDIQDTDTVLITGKLS